MARLWGKKKQPHHITMPSLYICRNKHHVLSKMKSEMDHFIALSVAFIGRVMDIEDPSQLLSIKCIVLLLHPGLMSMCHNSMSKFDLRYRIGIAQSYIISLRCSRIPCHRQSVFLMCLDWSMKYLVTCLLDDPLEGTVQQAERETFK